MFFEHAYVIFFRKVFMAKIKEGVKVISFKVKSKRQKAKSKTPLFKSIFFIFE